MNRNDIPELDLANEPGAGITICNRREQKQPIEKEQCYTEDTEEKEKKN